MSVTFDPSLDNDRDWVRFKIGDAVTATAVMQDETIDAILAQESNKWFAAATCAQAIVGRAKGLSKKKVDDLELTYEDDAESAYARLITELREEGALQLMQRPRHLFTL